MNRATLSISLAVIGVLVGAWMAVGRVLWGVSGDLLWWLAPTMFPVYAVLSVLTAIAVFRTGRAGHRTRPAVPVFLVFSWLLGLGFGLTVPENTPEGVLSILGLGAGEVAQEIGIGLCNPMATVSISLLIAAYVLARLDVRGPRAPRPEEQEAPAGMYAPDGTFWAFPIEGTEDSEQSSSPVR